MPTQDNTDTSGFDASDVLTATYPFTMGVGENPCVFLVASSSAASVDDGLCTGIQYAGVDMLETVFTGLGGSGDWVKIFHLFQPATGANNFVATFNGTTHKSWLHAISCFDVNPLEPFGFPQTKLQTAVSNTFKPGAAFPDWYLSGFTWGGTSIQTGGGIGTTDFHTFFHQPGSTGQGKAFGYSFAPDLGTSLGFGPPTPLANAHAGISIIDVNSELPSLRIPSYLRYGNDVIVGGQA